MNLFRRFLLAGLGFVLVATGSGADAGTPLGDPARWFAELKAVPQDQNPLFGAAYHDMHGNADRGIQELRVGRFQYTAAVCAEIDATNPKTHPLYLGALYAVLKVVCDPAAIPWLEAKLNSPRRAEVIENFVPRFGNVERWLVSPDLWAAFFEKLAAQETGQSARIGLASAMSYLETPRALDYFKRVAADKTHTGEELITALRYLHLHGIEPPVARVRDAVAALEGNREGQIVLFNYLDTLHSEAAVPWLLASAGLKDRAGHSYWEPMMVARSLATITFHQDPESPAEWRRWVSAHRGESRATWAKQAMDAAVALARKNPAAAAAYVNRRLSIWCDPLMLPEMERLVGFKELHDAISLWIDSADTEYGHAPGFTEKLAGLVEQLKQAGATGLETWGRNHLRPGVSFLTWEEAQRIHVF